MLTKGKCLYNIHVSKNFLLDFKCNINDKTKNDLNKNIYQEFILLKYSAEFIHSEYDVMLKLF